jgi:hypothetical protein
METSFTALDWSYATNIYEVNLRQYTVEGTFNAFAKNFRDYVIWALKFYGSCP